MTKEQILEFYKDKKEFKNLSSVVKNSDNTIRYYNNLHDASLIYYFNNLNICYALKIIEDSESIDECVNTLSLKYRRLKNLVWEANVEGNKIKIYINKSKYTYEIIFKKKE
ncbi:MAG: hypothetical protein N3A01_09110 [Bacteroidales bacterium]|nr:hypothetical protein [Bacteroidales bacterium]